MILRKWNYKANRYDPYEIPDDWNVSIVNCAECGKPIMFGQEYTGRKIHMPSGMRYFVCKDCYDKETEEELRTLHEAD